MRALRWLLAILILLGGAWTLNQYLTPDSGRPEPLARFTLDARPQAERYLFDYATLLEHYNEGAHNYLLRIAQRFHIEALIVTLPDLNSASSIQELAVDIVNRWQIGRNYEGRGLLLVLVDDEKQVKLEVGYELEDVFTDAFTGYVEDLQLRPYFRRNDLGTGLIAVMEELERRAQIKHQGDYTPGMIALLDEELLAGGGGAKRSLAVYGAGQSAGVTPSSQTGGGAKTPDEAWRIMLAKWGGDGAHIQTDIYTEMTKFAMGDQNKPDKRTQAAIDHWRSTQYRVLRDGDYAVIYFGKRDGWENAPFLFCKTPSGWKFDIVYQRRLVVMGPNPTWMVEQGNYPYVNQLREVRQSTGKDLPLPAQDLYSCAHDEVLAAQIQALEELFRANPDDYQTVIALARLNVITGRRPNHVHHLLERARKLSPESPEPYKYSAIYNVNTFLQYETALKDMQHYIEKRPNEAFGHNFIGFLHYRLGNYRASIDALEMATQTQPDNAYAYALMARDYALMRKKASAIDPRRRGYKNSALQMLEKAQSVPTPDTRRIAWLRSWLKRRNIL